MMNHVNMTTAIRCASRDVTAGRPWSHALEFYDLSKQESVKQIVDTELDKRTGYLRQL